MRRTGVFCRRWRIATQRLRYRAAFGAAVPLLLFGVGGCQPEPEPAQPAAVSRPAPKPHHADRVVVLKSKRVLELLQHGEVFETFPIALGRHPRGSKTQAGDARTPEGSYRIDGRTLRTRYSRALHISYPNARDRERAAARHVEPGGGILIHGLPPDFGPYDMPRWVKDWTEGCISVGNAAIVKIWDEVADGTPIDILP